MMKNNYKDKNFLKILLLKLNNNSQDRKILYQNINYQLRLMNGFHYNFQKNFLKRLSSQKILILCLFLFNSFKENIKLEISYL